MGMSFCVDVFQHSSYNAPVMCAQVMFADDFKVAKTLLSWLFGRKHNVQRCRLLRTLSLSLFVIEF